MNGRPGGSLRPRLSVWDLAWPTVIANLLQAVVGLVDIKAIGSIGPSAVAAATAGHRLFLVLQSMLMAASIGTTALVARAWGAGDREGASRVAANSLVLSLGLAATMACVGFVLAEPFSALLGLHGEVRRLAVIYTRWQSGFALAYAVAFVLGAALRATGDVRTPLAIGVLNNVCNVLGLWLFVYGGLHVTKLGIAGAALSGGLAFTAGSLLLLWAWVRGRLPFPPVTGRALDAARSRDLLHVAYPASLEQLVVQSGFIGFTFIISRYGQDALAAYGIGVQILSLSFVVGFGFSIAASTLVGQHLGAGDPERATASGWRAMRLAVGSMSVLSVVIMVLAEPIARSMIQDPEVVRLTVAFIYALGLAQPLMAVEFALGGAMRGAGDTRYPLLVTFTGLIIGRVALATLFARLGRSVEWVYGALLADYVLKSVLLIARFRSKRWQQALSPRDERHSMPSEPAIAPE